MHVKCAITMPLGKHCTPTLMHPQSSSYPSNLYPFSHTWVPLFMTLHPTFFLHTTRNVTTFIFHRTVNIYRGKSHRSNSDNLLSRLVLRVPNHSFRLASFEARHRHAPFRPDEHYVCPGASGAEARIPSAISGRL